MKTRFETWITRNDVNSVSLFNFPYLITLTDCLWLQMTPNCHMKYFMFDCSFNRLFVLNMFTKRDSFQMMIFVNGCSTWSMVNLKTRFNASILRNDVYVISWFHLPYLITHMAYLCSQRTPNGKIDYFMLDWSIYTLIVLNRGWKHYSFQMLIFVYIYSTWSIVEVKTRFETWITRYDVNGVSLFNFSYLITLMAWLCSQRHQMSKSSILFYWSIYRLFVLNIVRKRDSFQMMIFVNDCSTWSMVQLKTRFEASITRNDVYGVIL
jgi:hypothetical protein